MVGIAILLGKNDSLRTLKDLKSLIDKRRGNECCAHELESVKYAWNDEMLNFMWTSNIRARKKGKYAYYSYLHVALQARQSKISAFSIATKCIF